MATKFRITVTEHDSWSGPDSDYEFFDTLEEAEARIKDINSKNTLPYVPDYYVTAGNKVTAVSVPDPEPVSSPDITELLRKKFTEALLESGYDASKHNNVSAEDWAEYFIALGRKHAEEMRESRK